VFCWQAASLGSNTNNWNLNSLTINGVNFTGQYVAAGSNPAKINGPALQSLQDRVQGSNYLMLSPYPGLDSPISLQSWGHQLKLSNPADKRIDQFIQSLRLNQYTYPEVGASCDELTGLFDPAKPPPFVATPPGRDAIPMTYGGGRGVAPSTEEVPTAPGGAQSTPGLPAGG